MTLLDLLKVDIFVHGHTPKKFKGFLKFFGGGYFGLHIFLFTYMHYWAHGIISVPTSDVPSYIWALSHVYETEPACLHRGWNDNIFFSFVLQIGTKDMHLWVNPSWTNEVGTVGNHSRETVALCPRLISWSTHSIMTTWGMNV